MEPIKVEIGEKRKNSRKWSCDGSYSTTAVIAFE